MSLILSEKEQLLTAICNMVKIGIWEYDIKTGSGYWNNELYEIMGLSSEVPPPEMKDYGAYVLKKHVPILREKWSLMVNDLESFDIEVQIYTAQKKIIWVRAVGEPVVENGECIKVRGIFQNITSSKSVEITLQKTIAQLNNVINKVPGTVFRCVNNEKLNIEFISDQIADLSGHDPNEFGSNGKLNLSDIIKETDLKKIHKVLDQAKEDGDYEVQFRIITKEGIEKWVSKKGAIIENGGFIEGIITDINDRIRIEEKILGASLQAEDNERKRISKDLNDNVQQILASSLFSFQALDEYVKEQGEELKKLYQTGVEHLIKGLEGSRLIAYSIMPMSIADFGVMSTLESFTLTLQNLHNISIRLEDNLKGVRLNEIIEVSLYRIFQEGISNVIRHSKATEVTVKLWKYTDVVHFSIEDNGIGFDMKTNPEFQYEGLGIAYMKSRANSINASLEISSMVNIGTHILIEIPIDRML